MPTRRAVLGSVPAVLGASAGCSLLPSEGVAVVLFNGSHATHDLSAAVRADGETVFDASARLRASARTVYQSAVPADYRGRAVTVRGELASGASVEREVELGEDVAAVEVAAEPGGDLAVVARRG